MPIYKRQTPPRRNRVSGCSLYLSLDYVARSLSPHVSLALHASLSRRISLSRRVSRPLTSRLLSAPLTSQPSPFTRPPPPSLASRLVEPTSRLDSPPGAHSTPASHSPLPTRLPPPLQLHLSSRLQGPPFQGLFKLSRPPPPADRSPSAESSPPLVLSLVGVGGPLGFSARSPSRLLCHRRLPQILAVGSLTLGLQPRRSRPLRAAYPPCGPSPFPPPPATSLLWAETYSRGHLAPSLYLDLSHGAHATVDCCAAL